MPSKSESEIEVSWRSDMLNLLEGCREAEPEREAYLVTLGTVCAELRVIGGVGREIAVIHDPFADEPVPVTLGWNASMKTWRDNKGVDYLMIDRETALPVVPRFETPAHEVLTTNARKTRRLEAQVTPKQIVEGLSEALVEMDKQANSHSFRYVDHQFECDILKSLGLANRERKWSPYYTPTPLGREVAEILKGMKG